MSVQTIECQISTVLMKRFLDGDDLPQELLDGLEQHLKACPSCREIVNNEKVTIEDMLDGPPEPKGIQALLGRFTGKQTSGALVTTHPTQALIHAGQVTHSAPPGLAVFKNPKVLVLSSALALTLIAMSTVLKDPTKLFGNRASEAIKSGQVETEPEPESTKGEPNPKPAPDDKTEGKGTHSTDTPNSDGGHGKDPAAVPDKTHAGTSPDDHGEKAPPHGPAPDHPKSGSQAKPELPNDPRVPGEKTLQGNVVIVGGSQQGTKELEKQLSKQSSGATKQPQAKPQTEATKPTATQPKPETVKKPVANPYPAAPKPSPSSSSSHAKPATTTRPPARKTTVKRAAAKRAPVRKAPAKPKPAPRKPSGVKVYDPDGKPIN